MANVIGLLTDFGSEDIYVGTMKAVILNICPAAQIIDITHAIQPQNVREAAFALLNSYHYFPSGTTFLRCGRPGRGQRPLGDRGDEPALLFRQPGQWRLELCAWRIWARITRRCN